MAERRFEVKAEYRVFKTLTVVVEDDANPMEPGNWLRIESEDDEEYRLYDTMSAEEVSNG